VCRRLTAEEKAMLPVSTPTEQQLLAIPTVYDPRAVASLQKCYGGVVRTVNQACASAAVHSAKSMPSACCTGRLWLVLCVRERFHLLAAPVPSNEHFGQRRPSRARRGFLLPRLRQLCAGVLLIVACHALTSAALTSSWFVVDRTRAAISSGGSWRRPMDATAAIRSLCG